MGWPLSFVDNRQPANSNLSGSRSEQPVIDLVAAGEGSAFPLSAKMPYASLATTFSY
ncbi:hypothetical protein QNH14_04405 [Apirhabdus apintestini]|nr:hypothetical protein QNH14_04405 [Enterobacteriaceae bacterium CA-0114]